MARRLHEHHFVRSIRTSTANNTTAYGFSLAVAGSFGALTKVHGDPTWLELFLFLVGSTLGFAVGHPRGGAGGGEVEVGARSADGELPARAG